METISYTIERFLRKCISWKISPKSLEGSLQAVDEEVHEKRKPFKGRKRFGMFLKAPSEAKGALAFGWGQLKAVCDAVAGLQGRGEHIYNGLALRVAVDAADDLDKIKVNAAFTKVRKGGLKATDIMVPVALSRIRDDKINDGLSTVAHLILQKDLRRNFVYAVAVEDSQMTLWYFSHSATIKSKPFDYIEDNSTLVNVLISFMFSTERELGFDRRISYMPYIGFVYCLGEKSYLAISDLNQEDEKASSTSRRPTHVFKAIEIVWPTPIPVRNASAVIVKDTWVKEGEPAASKIERKILEDLGEFVDKNEWMGIKFVDNMRIDPDEHIVIGPQDSVFSSNKWKSLLIRSQLISTGEAENFQTGNLDVAYEPRQLVRYEKEGIRVDRLPNVGEAMSVLNDGAYMLYILFLLGWVHGDINVKNILGTKDETPGQYKLLFGTLEDMRKFKVPASEKQVEKFLGDIEAIWWTAVSILSTCVVEAEKSTKKTKSPFKLDKDVKKALQVELDADFVECLHEDLRPLAAKAEEFRARLKELESGPRTKREIYEAAHAFFSGISKDREVWAKATKVGLKPVEETFIANNPAIDERWKVARKPPATHVRFTKREHAEDDKGEGAKRAKLLPADKDLLDSKPADEPSLPPKDALKEAIAKFKLPVAISASAGTWALPTVAPAPVPAKGGDPAGKLSKDSPSTLTEPSESQPSPSRPPTPPARQEENTLEPGEVPASDTPAVNAPPVPNIPTGPRQDRGRPGAPFRPPMHRRAPSQSSSASGTSAHWARPPYGSSHRRYEDERTRPRFPRDRRDGRRY